MGLNTKEKPSLKCRLVISSVLILQNKQKQIEFTNSFYFQFFTNNTSERLQQYLQDLLWYDESMDSFAERSRGAPKMVSIKSTSQKPGVPPYKIVVFMELLTPFFSGPNIKKKGKLVVISSRKSSFSLLITGDFGGPPCRWNCWKIHPFWGWWIFNSTQWAMEIDVMQSSGNSRIQGGKKMGKVWKLKTERYWIFPPASNSNSGK